MAETQLILHVKGTENETTTLPKQMVRAAISQGQITHSQLIWSPTENRWKQVRELPHLLPSQKLAPAPTPRVATGTIPKVAASPAPTQGAVPRVAAAGGASPKAVPRVKVTGAKVAGAAQAQARAVATTAKSSGDLVVKEKHGPNPMKLLCGGLGGLILLVLLINYLMVDRPLQARLSQTAFSNMTVHAHLAAFAQPNAIVIHIPASSTLNNSNLSSFLVALAQSTPPGPMGGPYERVAITSGWTGTYSFSGRAWKELGDMGADDEATRREFILDQIGNAGGEPLITGTAAMTDDALQAKREKTWQAIGNEFIQR